MDKILHSFSLPYVLKLIASQTKIFVLLMNQEGRDNLRKCYTRHKFVSQIRHAFHSLAGPRNSNILLQFHAKFQLLCHKLSSSLK